MQIPTSFKEQFAYIFRALKTLSLTIGYACVAAILLASLTKLSWEDAIYCTLPFSLLILAARKYISGRSRPASLRDAYTTWTDAQKAEAGRYLHGNPAIIIPLLGKFAKVDGPITKSEIQAVEAIFKANGSTGEARKLAIMLFDMGKNGPLPFYHMLLIYKHTMTSDPALVACHILYMFQLAYADGTISKLKRKALWDTSVVLGFEYESAFEGYVKMKQEESTFSKRATSRIEEAYRILGCMASESDEKIKATYRNLAKTFHPDTIAGKALPSEFHAFADERFKQIREAYETIMASRDCAATA